MNPLTAPLTATSTSSHRAFADHASGDDVDAGEAVFQLLRDGLNAIEGNRADATTYILRAYALLERQRRSPQRSSQPEVIRGGLAPWQMQRATAFIDANLERAIGVRDLAQGARLSQVYFARAFRQSFGVTPHTYIYRRRMEQAQHRMLTTDEPLCQIALACGFANQSHLTRRFRQSTGVTPHAWRRAQLDRCRLAA